MTGIIRWEEPPASTAGRKSNADRQRTLEVLKQNPGKWALVAEAAYSSAVVPWKKLGCEAVGRRNVKDTKKSDIYARWPHTPPKVDEGPIAARARKAELLEAALVSSSPAAKTAKAILPISTAPKTLDLDDPNDAALLRQRQKYEAGRAARINRGSAR